MRFGGLASGRLPVSGMFILVRQDVAASQSSSPCATVRRLSAASSSTACQQYVHSEMQIRCDNLQPISMREYMKSSACCAMRGSLLCTCVAFSTKVPTNAVHR